MSRKKKVVGKDGLMKTVVKVTRSSADRAKQHESAKSSLFKDTQVEWAHQRKKALIVLSCVLALVVAGVIIWGVALIVSADPDRVPKVASQQGEDMDELFEAPITEEPTVVVRRFRECATPSERLEHVRDRDIVETHLDAYSEDALNGKIISIRPLSIVNIGGITCSNYMVLLESGNARLLSVIPTRSGMKVDWDAFAQYGTATWDEILKGKAQSADVRVLVKPVGYYSFAFRDESQWRCYLLSSPDLEQSVYAYARVGSKTHEILKSVARVFEGQGVMVTIRISKHQEGLKHRQFSLDQVLAIGWVLNKPETFEENWLPSHRYIEKGGIEEKLHSDQRGF